MKCLFKTLFVAFCVIVIQAPVLAYYSLGSPTGYVNDRAQVLSIIEREALETRLRQFEAETSNEIAIVTISSLQGDTIENFAVKLFEEWKVGKEGDDNGILLLIALQEREVRIEVGYGLEGVLTDAKSSWIIRDVLVPQLKVGNYSAGINGVIDQIISIITGEYVPSVTSNKVAIEDQEVETATSYEAFGAIGMFIFAFLMALSKPSLQRGLLSGILGFVIGVSFGGFINGLLWGFLLALFGIFAKGSGSGGGSSEGSRSGGGFGGFGGGRSGGGGASGRW